MLAWMPVDTEHQGDGLGQFCSIVSLCWVMPEHDFLLDFANMSLSENESMNSICCSSSVVPAVTVRMHH